MPPLPQLLCFWRSLPRISALQTCLRLLNEPSTPLPQTFFRLVFLCCISMGLFIVLSVQGQGLSFLSLPCSPRAEPTDCKNLQNSTPLVSKSSVTGVCLPPVGSSCRLPGVRFCFLFPLRAHVPLPHGDSPASPFGSQPHLCPCYPLRCVLFSTFSC